MPVQLFPVIKKQGIRKKLAQLKSKGVASWMVYGLKIKLIFLVGKINTLE